MLLDFVIIGLIVSWDQILLNFTSIGIELRIIESGIRQTFSPFRCFPSGGQIPRELTNENRQSDEPFRTPSHRKFVKKLTTSARSLVITLIKSLLVLVERRETSGNCTLSIVMKVGDYLYGHCICSVIRR
jgi:hypothetical protein